MEPITGLSADVFDVYQPDKWSSMVHNLSRMKAKDTLLSLCKEAQNRSQQDLEGIERSGSDEIPNISNQKKVDAQWIFWFRDRAARKTLSVFLGKTPLDQNTIFTIAPQYKHLTLAVILSNDQLSMQLSIAPSAIVDRRNLAAKLLQQWEQEHFLELCQALPEDFKMTLGPDLAPLPRSPDPQYWQTLIDQLECLEFNAPIWRLGFTLTKETTIELGAEIVNKLSTGIDTLLPLYRYIAWTPDNDFIEANKTIRDDKDQQKQISMNYRPGDRVRITAGLFSGKIGTVDSIDSKALTKVEVGNLSVMVKGEHLIPATS